ncbi:hypothetical protein V5O48_019622, partial [Marasmius crinis-equi]
MWVDIRISQKGRRTTPFYVSIVDLDQDGNSNSDSDDNGKSKSKKNAKKVKEKEKAKRKGRKGKDKEVETSDGTKTHGQWNEELKNAHACTKHGGQYCVALPNSGEHRAVSEKKISLWALLM